MSTTEKPSDPHVFAIAGLPGSGKSTTAEIITDTLQSLGHRAMSTEVSDFVRTRFEEQSDEDVDDNELGRWAAEQKEEHGYGYFLRELSLTLTDESMPHVAISGLRSPEEAAAVRDVFGEDNVTVLAIWTLPDIRFERKYGDEPSVDHPQWETFKERNERETHEWGCAEFFTDDGPSEYVVQNNGTTDQLETVVTTITRAEVLDAQTGVSMYAVAPFPSDTASRAAQYL